MSERLSYEDLAEIVDAHADALLLFARQWHAASLTPLEQAFFEKLDRLEKEPRHGRK